MSYSRAENAKNYFNEKNPKNKIMKVTSGRGAVAPVRVTVQFSSVTFMFFMQPFPSNCGVLSISGITPYLTSPENLSSILEYIDYLAKYCNRSGIIYTTTSRQNVLSKALVDRGYKKSGCSFRNRNSGNTILTFIRGVPA